MEREQKRNFHVQHSKYERNAPEISRWWYKLFDVMESEAAIQPDRYLKVVNKIFPEKLLNRIRTILTFIKICKKGTVDDDDSEEELHDQKIFAAFLGCMSDEEGQRKEIGPKNPYTKFFVRRLDRAAIWQTLPPLSFQEMNLNQKVEAITTEIAVDFVEWMKSVSSEDSPTTLTVPLVLKMFGIGFDTHAARSLQVRVKEMASVPDGVAILKNIPHMAIRGRLHQQLQRDLKASHLKKRVFAFGTKLDKEDQVFPTKLAEIDKWLLCTKVPQNLDSMATVWQGITHLRSTRAYCQYLLDHPEISPPKYLLEMNMLDPEMLKDQQKMFTNLEVDD